MTTPIHVEQVPGPQSAAEVPGTPPGTIMTKEYAMMVGRLAYVWGWPLVNNRKSAWHQTWILSARRPELERGVPAGINAVFRSPTGLVAVFPRVFQESTPEDNAAIQPLLNQILASFAVAPFSNNG